MEWIILHKEKDFETDGFTITKNHVELENGVSIDDYYVMENQEAVMILAIDTHNNIILKQEYRLPVKKCCLYYQ